MSDIILKINKLLHEKNISPERLGEDIGVTKQTIYNVLNKRVELKVNFLQKISKSLNVPIGYFFGEENGGINSNTKTKNSNNVDNKEEYDTLLSSYKVTVGALQSEIKTLKELIKLKDEKIDELKGENRRLKGQG